MRYYAFVQEESRMGEGDFYSCNSDEGDSLAEFLTNINGEINPSDSDELVLAKLAEMEEGEFILNVIDLEEGKVLFSYES